MTCLWRTSVPLGVHEACQHPLILKPPCSGSFSIGFLLLLHRHDNCLGIVFVVVADNGNKLVTLGQDHIVWINLVGIVDLTTADRADLASHEVIQVALILQSGWVNFSLDASLTEAMLAWHANPPVVKIQLSVANRTAIEGAFLRSSSGGGCTSSWWWPWWFIVDIDRTETTIQFVETLRIARLIYLGDVRSILFVPAVLKCLHSPSIEEVAGMIKELCCRQFSGAVLPFQLFDVTEI